MEDARVGVMDEDQVAIIIAGTVRTLLDLDVPAMEIAELMVACAAAFAEDAEDTERQEMRAHFARHLEVIEGRA